MIIDDFNKEVLKHIQKNSGTFWYWQGRVALYAILKAMKIKEGDEVIVPAYTCVVVPNAIIYLGAKPVYVDIDPTTYNMDPLRVEQAISPKTKVIVCQNTYGLSSNVEHILDLAKKHNLYTVEDCTHGFGGTYKGKPNGSYCDAAFYSTQWNKPFSTGLGGFAVTNNEQIKQGLQDQENKKIAPSFKDRLMLKVLYFLRNNIINDITYWPMIKLYRWLSKNNLVLGSSKGQEIEDVKMPEAYFKDFCETQVKEGLKNIKSLETLLIRRKHNAEIYTTFLYSKGKNHVDKKLFSNHSFLKYPLLVKNRDKFLKLAEANKISLGDWFISPLHPVYNNDWSKWFFEPSKYPVSMRLSAMVINLPTDIQDVKKVIRFLEENIEEVV